MLMRKLAAPWTGWQEVEGAGMCKASADLSSAGAECLPFAGIPQGPPVLHQESSGMPSVLSPAPCNILTACSEC